MSVAQLAAVLADEFLKAGIITQRREIRGRINRGEVAEPRVEAFLQRGQRFFFVPFACIAGSQPIKADRTISPSILEQAVDRLIVLPLSQVNLSPPRFPKLPPSWSERSKAAIAS
jgi:hypothetical protein